MECDEDNRVIFFFFSTTKIIEFSKQICLQFKAILKQHVQRPFHWNLKDSFIYELTRYVLKNVPETTNRFSNLFQDK